MRKQALPSKISKEAGVECRNVYYLELRNDWNTFGYLNWSIYLQLMHLWLGSGECDLFHLAVPSRNLKESENFYKNLGCAIGRKSREHIILDFFGHQVVCHFSGLWDKDPKMYPRHFGIVIEKESELKNLWERWKFADFIFEEYFVRHKDKREEHHTFFLKDPSNNLIEFKWYANKSAILG